MIMSQIYSRQPTNHELDKQDMNINDWRRTLDQWNRRSIYEVDMDAILMNGWLPVIFQFCNNNYTKNTIMKTTQTGHLDQNSNLARMAPWLEARRPLTHRITIWQLVAGLTKNYQNSDIKYIDFLLFFKTGSANSTIILVPVVVDLTGRVIL